MEIINIRIGSSVIIECEMGLAAEAGYQAPYSNDETRTARGGREKSYGHGIKLTPDQAVAIALSEGHTGEMAVMRAIALRMGGAAQASALHAESEAAKAKASAAQAELRAEQIRSARERRASEE